MINIEDLFISQPVLCAIASIEEYKGRWRERGGIDNALATHLKEKALKDSIATITDTAEKHNYSQLLEQIINHYEEINFFESTIKKLHKLLLADSLIADQEKGEYKQCLNPIYSKTIDGRPIDVFLETASPFETPQKTRKLLEWTRGCLENRSCHPLPVIALFMVHFLIIHPFQDGNSRLARALTELLLLKSGYDYFRFTSLEAAIENNKEEYYRCLRQIQNSLAKQQPDYSEWLIFFLRTLQRLQKRLEEQTKDRSKSYDELPALSVQILELAKLESRITLKQAVEKSGANINTVKKHLAALTKAEYLIRRGSARGTWYTKA